MELKRVVVTGLGAVTPVGNSPEETWENLLAGKSGAAPITHFDTTNFKTKFACEVKDLNVNEWIDRKEARKLDRYTQLAMIAAMQGVKDANIDLETEDLNNVGVVFGVGIGGMNLFCSAALVASAQFGKRFLQSAGPEWGTRVGAGCFFLMGTLKIFEELRKRRRKKQGKPEARLEHLEKQLHPLEFGLLAVSMSVDGIVSGVFAADLPVTGGQIFFASFAVGMAAMYAGTAIGKKTGQKNGGNGALFGGILFYLLAFLKLT